MSGRTLARTAWEALRQAEPNRVTTRAETPATGPGAGRALHPRDAAVQEGQDRVHCSWRLGSAGAAISSPQAASQ
jgi:hypothetical protein